MRVGLYGLGALWWTGCASLGATLHGSTHTAASVGGSSGATSEASEAGPDDGDHTPSTEGLDALATRMPGIAPEPGRGKAPVRAPAWCNGIEVTGYSPAALARTYEGWQKNGFETLIESARISCKFGNSKEGQVAATMIEQTWINLTGLSDPDAVESIRARIQKDAWKAQHEKLCAALTVSDEVQGEERAFTLARAVLFGCPGNAAWGETANVPGDVLAYLDQSATPPDELVRLSWVLTRTREAEDPQAGDRNMAGYPINSYDFRALSNENFARALQQPPYAGNPYAQAVAKESLARTRIQIAAIEQEAKKRAADKDWNEFLFAAPQRATAAYMTASARYKAEIARSNEFERKLFSGSRKAIAGCEAPLRKDFLGVFAKLGHTTPAEATESLSDPVASLLFSRLTACMSLDGDPALATELRRRVGDNVRASRGPRTAAYYGALEALGKIRADRERFPLTTDALKWFSPGGNTLDGVRGSYSAVDGYLFDGKGVVKSVSKAPKGVHVLFAHAQHQEMSVVCTPTNRIVQIRSDGTVQYYQNCHNAGMVTINDTPEDVVIPDALTHGITPGRIIEFKATRGHNLERMALPLAVYGDKSKKQLVAFYGFAM